MALDAVTLRKVQLKELEILLEIKRICDKHQIKYQLCGGTLLGAVRHKGFIPWDDDIDICMLREDYERFLEVAPKEARPGFCVESARSDPDYVYSFCKVKADGTAFIERCTAHLDIHPGIWVDVFPFDTIPEVDYAVLDRRDTRIRRWQTAVDQNAKVIRLEKPVTRLYFWLLGRLYPHKLMYKKEQVMQEANRPDNKYVIDYCALYGYRKAIFPMDTYTDLIELEFEGHLFPAARDYHGVLTQTYGDYMQLPPEEKRVSEHGIIRCEV